MRVYEASTLISAEFGGIRDLSRHLSLNSFISGATPHPCLGAFTSFCLLSNALCITPPPSRHDSAQAATILARL